MASLSDEDRRAIVRDYAAGVPLKEIGKRHGASPGYCTRLARWEGIPARKPPKVEMPRNSRFVSNLRAAIKQAGANVHIVSEKALGTRAAYHWMTRGTSPRIDNFEAVLNVLGLTLKIVPLEEKQQ